MSKGLYCPRCVKNPIGENKSLTDNDTPICDNCSKVEGAYMKAKEKGASDFTLNLWGFDKAKWPVNASKTSSWKSINWFEL